MRIGREEFPDLKTESIIVDNACMQLASNPHQFDVMITTNLYGNIIANVACGLIGGPGLLSGRNMGPKVTTNLVIFL